MADQQPPNPYDPRPQGNQGYGYGPPGMSPMAPFGVDPATGVPYSDKSKPVAGVLQITLPFLGICGVGRLYTGHLGIGLTQLLGVIISGFFSLILIGLPFLVGFWVWSVVDGALMLAGSAKDSDGRPLRP